MCRVVDVKVAIYARVSMDESSDDRRYQETENQLIPLREWANRNSWEIVREYTEKVSGANPNRPVFREMLKDARLRMFDTILVWKLDRFSREPLTSTMAYISELKRYGVGVRSLTETWLDTTKENPMGDLVLAIMSWAASEEKRKISERTKAGIRRLRAIGQWKGGRPPSGIVFEKKDGKWIARKGNITGISDTKKQARANLISEIKKGEVGGGADKNA